MNKSNLHEYIQLAQKLIESVQTENEGLTESIRDKFNKLYGDLLNKLISDPAGLIHFDDPEDAQTYQTVIKIVYTLFDENYLKELAEDELHNIEEIYTYFNRAPKLRPTVITIDPSFHGFNVFYNEAMRCWLFGMDNAAIILAATLVENALFNELEEELDHLTELRVNNSQPQGVSLNFKKLIDYAYDFEIITSKSRSLAHKLRKSRNNIVHNGTNITKTYSHNLINSTKDIIEDLYNHRSH